MIEVASQLSHGAFSLSLDIQLPSRGITVLFGPSGCGKTTLLRVIAGLEKGSAGCVRVNGATWQDDTLWLPPHRRQVGYVFQNPSLFSHLTVAENLAFGQRYARQSGPSLAEVAGTLELDSLLQRRTTELSGGEQQRVALGRALLAGPRLVLLDEPLSALDLASKARLIPFLENTLHLFDIPALHVTHSPDELVRLADHLVLMDNGRAGLQGPMVKVLSALDSPLAALDDAFCVLSGRLIEPRLSGLSTVESAAGNLLHVPFSAREAGNPVRLKIQARDVSLCLEKQQNTSILNILPAVVEEISEISSTGNCTIRLDLAGDKLLARISGFSREHLNLNPGTRVFAQVKAAALLH